jgi:hypothetical protein
VPKLDPFAIRFDPYHSPNRTLHIASASQDHRVIKYLPESIREAAFEGLRNDPRLRVIQFHAAVANRFVHVAQESKTDAVDKVELWWYRQPDSSARSKEDPDNMHVIDSSGVEMVVSRLAAEQCVHDLPKGTDYRMQMGAPKYLELVIRCAFLIEESLVPELLEHAKARASFMIYAADDVTVFPLAEVLHFPQPTRFLPQLDKPWEPIIFQAAPWANRRPRLEKSIVRAAKGSSEAAVRVGAVCTKKYSWSVDDELWLMWMLEIVGVDHVVIAVATRDFSMAAIADSIAKYPRMSERVTLIDLDIPTGKPKVTYSYMLECMGREAFLRWQADFDFIFLIDPDEFVQLFSADPPYPRIDVKTFVARHRKQIESQGTAYLHRPRIKRSHENKDADPLLSPFLQSLALMDGASTMTAMGPDADYSLEFGKSLFYPPRAVRSFLHYNPDSKPDWFPSREAHMLHIREGNPKRGKARQLQEYLAKFRKMRVT